VRLVRARRQHQSLLEDLGEVLTEGQELALNQLRRIEQVKGSPLRIDNDNVEEKKERDERLGIDVSFDCANYERAEGGIQFHARESVRLWIPPDFPFQVPEVWTAHTRFRGRPHVQWGMHLCLYQSTDTQWKPSHGMVGFVEQLDNWFRKAALNELDNPEMPIHPPVAYPSSDAAICILANAPGREKWPWFGAGILKPRKPGLFEITDWKEIVEIPREITFAPTVLLDFELPFEYPKTVRQLLAYLEKRGIQTSRVLFHLMLAAERLDSNMPLHVVLGAPSRGIAGARESRLQHLQIWEIKADDVEKLRVTSIACDLLNHYEGKETPEVIQKIIDSVFQDLFKWQEESQIRWCPIFESRPEIVTRRDVGSAMDWFRGKTVALWGCGALGSLIAEHLVRSGVKCIALYDNKKVNPGVLVRQNFDFDSINEFKAEALKKRLKAINPDIEVVSKNVNLIRETLNNDDWQNGTDLVIDATASLRIRSKLEAIFKNCERKVPVAAMMISGAAKHGSLVLSPVKYSGGTLDAFRRLGLSAMHRSWLKDWVDAFWDAETQEPARQPEPGCSDPTFVGSHADVAVLAARMLNRLATDLAKSGDEAMGCLLAQDTVGKRDHIFYFRSDVLIDGDNFQFRISPDAWRDIRGWINSCARIRSPEDETGGLLFGQFDETLGIGWITNVSGPPKDSMFSPEGFVCGIEGTEDLNDKYKERSHRTVQYVGTWHSHPVSQAIPSETDYEGIATIFSANPSQGAHQLMMIVGNSASNEPEMGMYVFEKQALNINRGHVSINMAIRGGRKKAPQIHSLGKSIGLALSGGGSRAVAFHLGALRALNDLNLLDDVKIISGVSGGSLMAGLLGYSNDNFLDIDRRTLSFLKRGLIWPSIRKMLNPIRSIPLFGAFIFAAIPAVTLGFVKNLLVKVALVFPGGGRINRIISSVQWPIPRWYSQSDIMVDAISEVVGSKKCDAPTRDNKNVVFNACELRTGTAFRMSNERFGSWRFGWAPANQLSLAKAVTASAAYPPFLPAFDWPIKFIRGNKVNKARVIITDGGVYENIGVSVMEPNRDQSFSIVNYSPEIIIACDAGTGQFSGEALPVSWSARMVQVVNNVMRKVQDATKERLHRHTENGLLNRFIYVYLGQIDNKVLFKTPMWIDRESVANYPTDFSAMTDLSIHQLTGRGEAIARALVTQYLLSD
jgi:predicted acylesterase/phospholipase RssA/proteasome lid subunit RPN8/RPN11